jgi:hypothetical protein
MQKYIFIVLFAILFLQRPVLAQWNANPSIVNNPVSTAITDDVVISSVTDGAGGAIIAWTAYDILNATFNIAVQRKTVNGAISWNNAATPVNLFSSAYSSSVADIIPDGYGGVYITWVQYLSDYTTDLYLQRISATGNLLFTPGGIKINASNGHFYSEGHLAADAGGVIIAWTDQLLPPGVPIPSYAQVFAQRFNTVGVAQWTPGGVQVSTAAGLRALPEIIPDGSNGAFIAFADSRNSGIGADGEFDNIDLYAQHLGSTGSQLWGPTDALVSNADSNQFIYSGSRQTGSMIPDNSGGMIIIFEDYQAYNNDNNANLFAQRLNSSGTRLWPGTAVPLANATNIYKDFLHLANDGADGVVATWDELNFSTGGEVHAQRITNAGTADWGANGILLTTASDPGFNSSTMTGDGSGNYVITWSFLHPPSGNIIIRGQKLNGAGLSQWTAGGVDICTNPSAMARNPKIIKSNTNTTLVTWEDSRNLVANNMDIYAARISSAGTLVFVNPNNYNTIANGSWNNPAIWAGNVVPPAGANIFILHNVTANINTTCNTLRVISPGVLTVSTGINVSVLQ